MSRSPSHHTGITLTAILCAVGIGLVSRPVAGWSPSLTGSSQVSSPLLETGEESRKGFLLKSVSSCMGLVLASSEKVNAAETVGKDPDCDDLTCLGVWDGLLADCPHGNASLGKFVPGLPGGGAGCTSSQDDTPGIFSEPWDYSESSTLDYTDQMRLLRPTIERVSARRGDKCEILIEKDRYLRALIVDATSSEKSIAEFYFTPNDTTVQFRIGSVVSNKADAKVLLRGSSLRNIERGEMIRKELRYLKLPVLRNRKRSLFFVESDLDQFGPGSASLGPPAEMKTGELDGRFSDNVDPKMKIDAVQQFPFAK